MPSNQSHEFCDYSGNNTGARAQVICQKIKSAKNPNFTKSINL